MAVQQITGKIIKKFNERDGNFQAKPKPVKEVDGNKVEEDIYGEKKHTYVPDANGNLQMEQLMDKMLNKLDNIPGVSQTGIKPIEVDIKREIAIGKADMSDIKSQEFKGKVKTQKDKLKALRRKRYGKK